MPSYYFNERFYIVYNINLIMFYDLLIFIFMSYIKPQPASSKHRIHPDCISYYSYIKPQLFPFCGKKICSCISYYSYIKPQLYPPSRDIQTVVYRTIPTSNHNEVSPHMLRHTVVYRTIPTSNHNLQLPSIEKT